MRVEQFLSRFEKVKRAGGGWSALCAGHEDSERSLSIGYAEGKILVKCHAGCETEDVLRAVGLSFKDIMPESNGVQPQKAGQNIPELFSPPTRPRIVATYIYTDEGGEPLYRVVRYDNKKFSQERYTKNKKWAKGLADVRRVPYRMHEVAAASGDVFVFIPEGEKDCDNLVKLGLIATTNQGGAVAWRQIADEARTLLRGRSVVILPDNDGPGKQHAEDIASSLVDVAGSVQILELPGLKPKGDVSDWIAAGGTREQLVALAGDSPIYTSKQAASRIDSELRDLFAGTDKGSAELFLRTNHHDVRYVPSWKKWLVWNGKHWRPDSDEEAKRRAQRVIDLILEDAKRAQAASERNKLFDWARRLASEAKTQGLLKWALADERICAAPGDLDAKPYLLNCQNGTVDLRTGKLGPHERLDRLTKIIPVTYDPNAEAPTWLAFLERVLPDPELRSFVQRAVGYSLTGDIGEQCMFTLHGLGANGKSTLVETIRDMLGDYARATEQSTFMMKQAEGVRNDLAMLCGARFVTATETESGRHLAEALVKQATGGEAIVARFLYANFFEYRPEFKVWLSTNHKPQIKGTDEGIWRRIRLIPFSVTIPPKERDSALPQKLRAEVAGILRWSVEGCLKWQREGLGSAGAVEKATKEYRLDQDAIGRWLEECCARDEYSKQTPGALYDSYLEWCKGCDEEEVLSKKLFGKCLSERGFKPYMSHGRRFWLGIALRVSGSAPVALFLETPNSNPSHGTLPNTCYPSATRYPEEEDPPNPSICEEPRNHLTAGVVAAAGAGWTREPGDDDA